MSSIHFRTIKSTEWISVKDMLPNKFMKCLVTLERNSTKERSVEVLVFGYYDDEWDSTFGYKVVAWMPLPKAYE